jgi:hypothetical protein
MRAEFGPDRAAYATQRPAQSPRPLRLVNYLLDHLDKVFKELNLLGAARCNMRVRAWERVRLARAEPGEQIVSCQRNIRPSLGNGRGIVRLFPVTVPRLV